MKIRSVPVSTPVPRPNTFFAENTPKPSNYSFATVFNNDYLNALTGKVFIPKNGDALIVPEMNAVYKYIKHPTTDNPLRVYVYQAFRENQNITNAEIVANFIGNFTCTYSSNHTDGKYHYEGDLADSTITSDIANTGNPHIYTIGGKPEFETYMGEADKKSPLIFKDSPFRLVANFTLPWGDGNSPSDMIKAYLSEHSAEFPLLTLNNDGGGVINGTICVIEADGVTFNNEYEWICSKFIDSSLALEAYSPSLKQRNILFEFWSGGCVFAGSNTNYIVNRIPDSIDYEKNDYSLTWYWADEGGRENFELRLEKAGEPNPKNYNGSGSIKSITSLTNNSNRLVKTINKASDCGYWVYDQPISDIAFNRSIEIVNGEPKTVSNTPNGVTYTYDNLVEYCKTGDVVIIVPKDGSLINFSITSGVSLNLSVWECQTSRPGKNRQVWKKLL